MHTIQDLKSLTKKVEETVYHFFGTGFVGEQGKDAILAVIADHIVENIPVGVQIKKITTKAKEAANV